MPSISDTSDSFNDNFHDAQDTVRNTTKTISTAWIVGIVIIVLAVITSAGVGIYFLRRRSKIRSKRKDLEDEHYDPNPAPTTSAPGGDPSSSGGRVSPYPQHQQHPQYQPPMQQQQQYGAQTRSEAQDTGVGPYWEAPDTSAPATKK